MIIPSTGNISPAMVAILEERAGCLQFLSALERLHSTPSDCCDYTPEATNRAELVRTSTVGYGLGVRLSFRDLDERLVESV